MTHSQISQSKDLGNSMPTEALTKFCRFFFFKTEARFCFVDPPLSFFVSTPKAKSVMSLCLSSIAAGGASLVTVLASSSPTIQSSSSSHMHPPVLLSFVSLFYMHMHKARGSVLHRLFNLNEWLFMLYIYLYSKYSYCLEADPALKDAF